MTWGKFPQMKDTMAEPYTLKDFIDEYMSAHPEIDSYNKFAQHAKVSATIIGRVVREGHKPDLEVIKKIADATHTPRRLVLKIVHPELFDDELSVSDELLTQMINRLPGPIRDVIIKFIRVSGSE